MIYLWQLPELPLKNFDCEALLIMYNILKATGLKMWMKLCVELLVHEGKENDSWFKEEIKS